MCYKTAPVEAVSWSSFTFLRLVLGELPLPVILRLNPPIREGTVTMETMMAGIQTVTGLTLEVAI